MKILIVEDEFNAREGLAAIIQKNCPQHEICGKAADGEEGFQLAVLKKPDLIFVDIELPKLNGLKMIEKLVDRNAESAFVILSGYAEFEYAQQAIRYGVSEYLLKPITYEKLIHVIENMDKWQNIKKEYSKKEIPQNELLKSVLSHRNDSKEAWNILNNIIVPLHLYVMNLYLGKESDPAEIVPVLDDFCGRYGFENVFLSIFPDYGYAAVLINAKDTYDDLVAKINYRLFYTLHQRGLEDFTLTLLRLNRLEDLTAAMERLRRLNSWALSLGNGQVLTEEMIPAEGETGRESNKVGQINMEALSAIKNGEPEKLVSMNRRLLELLADQKSPPDRVRNICTQYVLSALVCYKEMNANAIEEVQNMSLFDDIKNCCTRNEMLHCLDRLISFYHDILPDQAKISSILVRKTIDYIAHSYAERVSLEAIAAKMKVTPEYISHLFTKEVGISFSDYLKKYRIDTAKKLMKNPHYKIYEIGEKIGYKDPKYFYKMFKEVTGYSPKEYQKREL